MYALTRESSAGFFFSAGGAPGLAAFAFGAPAGGFFFFFFAAGPSAGAGPRAAPGIFEPGILRSASLTRRSKRWSAAPKSSTPRFTASSGVEGGAPRLGIQNQTVRRLMYGYLRDAYDDVGAFSVDLFTFARLTREMARDGAWRPAVEFLAGAIARQTAIRVMENAGGGSGVAVLRHSLNYTGAVFVIFIGLVSFVAFLDVPIVGGAH